MFKRGILRAKSLMNPGKGKSLIDAINFCGLQTGLLTCIDAGDRRSYTGNRRYVYDLSGNNNHWRYGIGGSVGATTIQGGTVHPLFYGKVGGLSENEYFSGSTATATTRRFTPYLGTETYDDAWHQNNGVFTAAFVTQSSGSALLNLLNNQTVGPSTSTLNGIAFAYNPGSGSLSFAYDAGTGAADAINTSLSTPLAPSALNRIVFVAVSFDENANIILVNNSANSTTASTASTNVTAASQLLSVGSEGDGGVALLDTRKIFCWAIWNTALSAANLLALRENLKQTRYPGLP